MGAPSCGERESVEARYRYAFRKLTVRSRLLPFVHRAQELELHKGYNYLPRKSVDADPFPSIQTQVRDEVATTVSKLRF
jgi:hypothetical protein